MLTFFDRENHTSLIDYNYLINVPLRNPIIFFVIFVLLFLSCYNVLCEIQTKDSKKTYKKNHFLSLSIYCSLSLTSTLLLIFTKVFLELLANVYSKLVQFNWELTLFVLLALSALKILFIFVFDYAVSQFEEHSEEFIIKCFAITIAVSEGLVFVVFDTYDMYTDSSINLFSAAIFVCFLSAVLVSNRNSQIVDISCFENLRGRRDKRGSFVTHYY